MDVPHTIGDLTLLSPRPRIGGALTFEANLASHPGPRLIARRIPASLVQATPDSWLDARLGDLTQLGGHGQPGLVHALKASDGWWTVEEAQRGISLSAILQALRERQLPCPPLLLLSFACDLCTQIEALHSRPGLVSGASHLLHLHLTPDAMVFPLEPGTVRLRAPGWTGCPITMDSAYRVQHTLTLDYLAPEQTEPNREVGKEADLFAIGAILVECITGAPPFRADDAMGTVAAIREADLRHAEEALDGFIPELVPILQRTMTRNPSKRYRRAFALREDLRGLMARFDHRNLAAQRQRFLKTLLEPSHDDAEPSGGVRQRAHAVQEPPEVTVPLGVRETASVSQEDRTAPGLSTAPAAPNPAIRTEPQRASAAPMRAAALVALLMALGCAIAVLATFLG